MCVCVCVYMIGLVQICPRKYSIADLKKPM